jgi:hypothetical protein
MVNIYATASQIKLEGYIYMQSNMAAFVSNHLDFWNDLVLYSCDSMAVC